MSFFESAVEHVLKNEGGYVNHPGDPGGATNLGISLRFLKTLKNYENSNIDTIKNLSKQEAILIYKKYFWEENNLENIKSFLSACKIFDLCVNMGARNACILAQKSVRAVTGEILKLDGILGSKSFNAINKCPSLIYIAVLKAEASNYYLSIKDNAAFIDGWLKRAYSCC